MRAHLKLALCSWLPLGTLAVVSASGESLYVDDKLVLNVYAEADQTSSRVATIETGDAVEALEHVENFVRVQLADGREGWVSSNYLKAQPPAMVRLREQDSASISTDTKRHTDEIARLKKQNAALHTELADLKKKLVAVATPIVPAAHPPEPPVRTVSEPVKQAPALAPVVIERTFWWAWLIAVIVAGAGGFVAGYQTLGKRVRERFGGVKVY